MPNKSNSSNRTLCLAGDFLKNVTFPAFVMGMLIENAENRIKKCWKLHLHGPGITEMNDRKWVNCGMLKEKR